MEKQEKNYFEILNAVDVSDKVEKKNNLSYLSWSFAWGELKKKHPDAFYTIYETSNGIPYFTDGRTCWVKTGVTVNGLEHIEYLPIMDFRNQSIPFDKVTSMDMNKAIQRSLTKAVARHGLGLYVYAGEDLPEEARNEQANKQKEIEEAFAVIKPNIMAATSQQMLTEINNQQSDELRNFAPYRALMNKRFTELKAA